MLAARRTAVGSPIVREFLLLGSSTVLYQGSRFAVGFLAARILGPSSFGLWQTLYLISIYGGGASLGIINAMDREVPYFKGKGEPDKVQQVRRNSLGFLVLGTLGLAAIIMATALAVESSVRGPLLLATALFVFFQFHAYIRYYLKSDRRFNLMSLQQLALAVVLLAAAVPLTLAAGLSGFILGNALAFICASVVVLFFVSFGFRVAYDWTEIGRLVKIGFPIMCGGYIYLLLTTGDRIIIAGFPGSEELGFYSLVILLSSALSLIPSTVSQLIYPRMAEIYGKTGDPASLRPWVIKQAAFTFGIALLVLVCIHIWFPVFVERFLPEYTPGITAVRIVLTAFLFFLCVEGVVNFLYVINRQMQVLYVQAVGFVLNIALNVSFVALGWGINGVAAATALSYGGYFLAFALVGWWLLKERRPAR